MNLAKQDQYLKEWLDHETCAEEMLPLIGRLYREKSIVITVYGSSLVLSTPIDIMTAHREARKVLDSELTVRQTFPLLDAICKLDLAPARIDLGKLTVRYLGQADGLSVDDFVRKELVSVNTGSGPLLAEPQDIVLYGFGRIGRLLARILVEKKGGGEKL